MIDVSGWLGYTPTYLFSKIPLSFCDANTKTSKTQVYKECAKYSDTGIVLVLRLLFGNKSQSLVRSIDNDLCVRRKCILWIFHALWMRLSSDKNAYKSSFTNIHHTLWFS